MTTDPFDDLKRAFERATPEPDAERRKANLARAGEMFDRAKDAEAERRHTDDRLDDWAAIPEGARTMLKSLVSRPVFVAVGALAGVGLAVVLTMAGRGSSPATQSENGSGQVARVVPSGGPETSPRPGERAPVRPGAEPEPEAPARDSSSPPPAQTASGAGPKSQAAEQPVLVASSDAAPEAAAPVSSPASPSAPTDTESEPESLAVEQPVLVASSDAAPEAAAPVSSPASPSASTDSESGPESQAVEQPVLVASSDAAPTTPGPTARASAEAPPVLAEARVGKFNVSAGSVRIEAHTRGRSGPAAAFSVVSADPDARERRRPDSVGFANEDASPVRVAAEDPVSTFSVDVDTASYSVVRTWLNEWGELPDPDSVRIEELLNYFPYAYEAPGETGAPFRPTVTVSETPWNPDTLLMHIGIQGRQPETEDRPPLNLVFLIDTSGSMDDPKKLPLLVQSFRLMLGQLDAADEVAIVTYADSARRVLDATPATDRGAILAALEGLGAEGSTAGAGGIQLAYVTAGEMAAEGEVTRVLLATDGDFNVGIHDPDDLEAFIARRRDSGVYLSVLGFGRDGFDDATMQALAQNGNGQAAYIDTLAEAQKVLVDQLVGTLFPIANDVKIQVEFNPAEVAEYRLIGYETRALRREDFRNDRVDAGEIGAGHAVTALYEVTPVGSPAALHEPLRYAARPAEPPAVSGRRESADELAFLRIRYKAPGEDASELIERPVRRDEGEAGEDQRFAAAVAGFGQLLRDGAYLGDWSWADAIALAEASTGADLFGYRREAVTLMRLAESLAESQ